MKTKSSRAPLDIDLTGGERATLAAAAYVRAHLQTDARYWDASPTRRVKTFHRWMYIAHKLAPDLYPEHVEYRRLV